MLKVNCTLVAILGCLVGNPSYAEQNMERHYGYYQSLRAEFFEQFRTAIKLAEAGKRQDATNEEFAKVVEAIKSMYYNKAFIYVQCFQRAPTSQDPNLSALFMKDCIRDRLEALGRVYKFAHTKELERSTAVSVNRSVNQAKAREAELDYPPFDFLVGPNMELFDMKQLDDCVGRLR